MKKLLVFMIDALCSSDIEYMKTLPNFKTIIENGSYVHHLYPVHPALTYCAHTTIVTGRYVDGHGIANNERLVRGCRPNDVWYGKKEEVLCPTFLDEAMKHGLTTCSLSWPVSAGANYTYNWPMYVPYHYDGYHPEKWLEGGMATQNLLDAYFWKYGRYIKGPDSSLDNLTMSIAPDLIRDFGQPDVMLVKMCDLDTIRHTYGVYANETKIQLNRHDEELGVLLESLRRYGDLENTNIVIMGDHGQTDIVDVLNINKVLQNAGFIRCDEEGNIIDCDCYAHSAALTCFIELKDPNDKVMEKKVKDFLLSLKDDPEIKLLYALDKEEMKKEYHLEGPFDFVIESARDISFSENLKCHGIWGSKEPGDHKIGAATHGSRPDRAENTLFIACGPSVKKGVVIEQAEMVDEAVTMSAMIGFDFPNTDGRLLKEMLND
ncbi:MAG: alkaline phosphatase family protein [Erysipelotrichaceae bacterium]|nr:alkaline phosphatase family protein [Erysipelotrichaceae bacterium]